MNYLTRHDSLDDFFRGFFVRPVAMESTTTEAAPVKIDVREQEDQYYVQAELPGVKREDIQIHVDGATVSLTRAARRAPLRQAVAYVSAGPGY